MYKSCRSASSLSLRQYVLKSDGFEFMLFQYVSMFLIGLGIFCHVFVTVSDILFQLYRPSLCCGSEPATSGSGARGLERQLFFNCSIEVNDTEPSSSLSPGGAERSEAGSAATLTG
jgi:hypothetical protein